MSALRTHEEGDCWWPCHYCLVEDDHAPVFLEPNHDNDGDDE